MSDVIGDIRAQRGPGGGTGAGNPDGAGRGRKMGVALVVALVGFVAWDVAFTILRPELVGDEKHHVPAIQDAARGDWTKALELPMPPTYHWLAAWATRVVGPELWALRAFQTFCTLLAIWLYHTAARAYRPDYAGRDLPRFAWHPLIVAFGALVCTDIAALVGILIALNFHVRRRYVLAAIGLVAAILIRQSNVLWAAYFLVWALGEDWLAAGVAPGGSLLRGKIWPAVAAKLRAGAWAYLLVFVVGGAAVAIAGRGVLLARAKSNAPAFNLAVFYLLAITAALLWLPVWTAWLAEFWPRRFMPALLRPRRVAALVAAVGVVTLEFRNPHPWNMDPEFPHNWPLYAMVQFPAVRALLSAVIVCFAITCAVDVARSPARRLLGLTWAFTLVFLAPHNLADLRYYIVPLVLIEFLTPRGPREGRVLAAWSLGLSAAAGALLAFQLGGVKGML